MLFFKPKKNTSVLSDDMLIAEYRRTTDSNYIGELFIRYSHLVFGVCMKYLKNEDDAQDMTMLVFEKLISDLKVHRVENFKAWLYMVTKNQCLMHFRKEKQHIVVELNSNALNDDDDAPAVEKEYSSHLDDAELKEMKLQTLEEGITQLTKEQKVCVELFYLQNKSYTEVASITGYDMKQVKSYIQNGKRNLQLYMSKKNV